MPCPPHLFAPFRPPGWSPGRTISRSVSPAWTTKRTLTGVAQPGQQRELLSLQNKDPLQNNKETPSRAAQPAPLRELRGCALCPRFVLRSRRGVCVCVRAQTSGLSWARAARRSRLAAWPGTSRRWCRSAFSPNGGAKEMDDAHPCPTPPALSSLLVPHQHTRRWRQRDGCSATLSHSACIAVSVSVSPTGGGGCRSTSARTVASSPPRPSTSPCDCGTVRTAPAESCTAAPLSYLSPTHRRVPLLTRPPPRPPPGLTGKFVTTLRRCRGQGCCCQFCCQCCAASCCQCRQLLPVLPVLLAPPAVPVTRRP